MKEYKLKLIKETKTHLIYDCSDIIEDNPNVKYIIIK
jgi:hypothetical protein